MASQVQQAEVRAFCPRPGPDLYLPGIPVASARHEETARWASLATEERRYRIDVRELVWDSLTIRTNPHAYRFSVSEKAAVRRGDLVVAHLRVDAPSRPETPMGQCGAGMEGYVARLVLDRRSGRIVQPGPESRGVVLEQQRSADGKRGLFARCRPRGIAPPRLLLSNRVNDA